MWVIHLLVSCEEQNHDRHSILVMAAMTMKCQNMIIYEISFSHH
jgi:hypothetical protein